MSVPHRCPVCLGRGVVSYPPGVAAGQSFASTSAGPWPCQPCGGTGLLWSAITAFPVNPTWYAALPPVAEVP